jgi:hypothetical protein
MSVPDTVKTLVVKTLVVKTLVVKTLVLLVVVAVRLSVVSKPEPNVCTRHCKDTSSKDTSSKDTRAKCLYQSQMSVPEFLQAVPELTVHFT